VTNYRIHYILPMQKQNLKEASPFFGYTPGVLSCLQLAQRIMRLPQHVIQLTVDKDSGIAMRMSGGSYDILPADLEVLPELPINASSPFWCILSSDETATAVSSFVSSCIHPVLHTSTAKITNAVPMEKLDWNTVLQYCHRVLGYLKSINAAQAVNFLRDLPRKSPARHSRRLSLKRRHHFVTFANELTLESNGYTFAADARLYAAQNNGPYISAIRASAHAISRERNRIAKAHRLMWPPPFNLILTCPAFYRHMYNQKLPNDVETRPFRKLISAYRRQTKYSINASAADLKDFTSSEAGIVVEQYRREIAAYSNCVAVKAANHFVPVYRLPPAVNLVYEDFALLGACSRADPLQPERSMHKQNRLFRRISDRLAEAVPKEFLPDIDRNGNQIKLITNAPLEWVPVRGLPLMLRHEVSRIPTTPGNVTCMQTVLSRELGATSAAFKEILVVRSFEPGDVIRDMLSNAINTTQPRLAVDMKINIADVSTPEEFLNVVNQFEGMVMIFDGHGRASIKDVGAIIIGGKPVDLYQFRTRLRVPPIVILSSCDTHAIDGSHASVANTFLMLGATTVLGTLLPVNAASAAVFTSRLVLRISEFIPLVTKKIGGALRWSSVVAGMQKMVYVSEQVRRLFELRRKRVSFDQHRAIQMGANNLILTGDPDWYEKTVGLIAGQLQQSEEATREELAKHQLVDVIKYIQLGNPDQILIADRH
jgi:CHAT domain